MKKTAFLFVLCGLFTNVLHAQAPSFDWAVNMGGSGSDVGHSIATDAAGDLYTTGWFRVSTDFAPGSSYFSLSSAGICDIFVQKISKSGNLVWAKSMGGPGVDRAYAIALSDSGFIYLTGRCSEGSDLDPGTGEHLVTSAGSTDIFVLKLDASGNLLWARTMGGPYEDAGYSIAVDSKGNVAVTGEYQGSGDFDPGTGTATLTALGGSDVFIQKFDASGNFIWAKSIGSNSVDIGRGIAVDLFDNVIISGEYQGTCDFDPGPALNSYSSVGGTEGFLMKLSPSGNLKWANTLGDLGDDDVYAIAVSSIGDIYTTGWYSDTVDFDPGPAQHLLNTLGGPESFVMKSDSTGQLIWAKSLGGAGEDYGYDIVLDAAENVFTTGYFELTADFDPGPGVYQLTSPGVLGIYSHKLDNLGNFGWAVQMGGPDYDVGHSLAIDAQGSIYTTGEFTGSGDFDPGAGVFNMNAAGSQDISIQKMSQCPSSAETVYESVCGAYSSPSGLYTWNKSGSYMDIIPNAVGCDSVITVNLTVNKDQLSNLTVSSCTPYSSPSGKYFWSTSGTYHDTMPTSAGCNHFMTIELNMGGPTSATVEESACLTYTSPDGQHTWTKSGIYMDTIPNASGCDSLLTIKLTIDSIDNEVSLAGDTLLAIETGATYQWLDCDDGHAVITGAINRTFQPTATGNYAVVVEKNSCVDTSACRSFVMTGIAAGNENNGIRVYPNPTKDRISITTEKAFNNALIRVTDLTGRLLIEHNVLNGQKFDIDLTGEPAGIYFVEISEGELLFRSKLVKE